MKKIIPILLAFFSFAYISIAQTTFIPTLANELLSTARTEAAKKITNPQLLSIATINGNIPGLEISGKPINIIFTTDDGIDKGKASAWVFLFNSQDDTSKIVAMVTGMTPVVPLAIDPADYKVDISVLESYVSNNTLDGLSWINSDAMVDRLKSSSEYINFIHSYPNAVAKMIALGFADTPSFIATNPYWFVSMNAVTDSLIIAINALTGEVSDVNEFANTGLIVYPNPAQNIINTIIPDALVNPDTKISILNILGKKVKDIDNINVNNLQINLKGLNSGNYFLRLESKNSHKVVPFVIIK